MFKRLKKKDVRSQKGYQSDFKRDGIPRTMSIESVDSMMSDAFSVVSDQSNTKDFKLANIFWRPKLSCHPFHVGDPLVTYDDLWPDQDLLRGLIACFKGAELQDSVVTCCKLVLRCGPIRVLHELLDQRIINIDQRLESGMGLLHYAVLACNGEAVTFLCNRGAPIKLTDKSGRTAEQICYCSKTRRCLPARYQNNSLRRRKQPTSFHDKKVIFELVHLQDKFNDLQILIQTMDFDINHDKDQKGDLLLHAAVRGGLPHLALIMNLVQVHGANVEATNRKGMTPLCLAAQLGLDMLVEVLICIIGADPNTQNTMNGWTALHYAAKKNQHRVIDCLIKRGADLNMEDNFSMRADDIALRHDNHECHDLICSLRYQRCINLNKLVCTGNLGPNDKRIKLSDQYNINQEGFTLIMAAAKANRCDNLGILLKAKNSPVNAQHYKTGRTALVMAALDGNANVIQTLLSHNAEPCIKDVHSRLALYYACIRGHVDCVTAILQSTSGLHGLADVDRVSSAHPIIKDLIRVASKKRQREITNPTLFECAMNGDAEKIFSTLEAGDDVNPLTGTSDWPMYMAVGNGHFEVIKLLQQYDGDVASVHSKTGSTVLHVACSRGLRDITEYLLQYCQPNNSGQLIDINAVNKAGFTALQLAASKGYSNIVKMLLERGASAAIVDDNGRLYHCTEFEGVQALIERHRKNRTERIMLAIKDRKRLKYLKKMWQPKFDHNLRNKAGDTPLMTASLNGRLDAVKFLLGTAVQNTEEEARNFERSMRWRANSDSDSGTFFESYSPATARKHNSTFEASTDMSDFDVADTSAMHPSRYDLYPSCSTPRPSQDYSSDSDTNTTLEHLKKEALVCTGSHRNSRSSLGPRGSRPYSDTETLDNVSDMPYGRGSTGAPQGGRLHSISEDQGFHYSPSLASIRSVSQMSLTDTECTNPSRQPDLFLPRNSRGNLYGGSHSRTTSMSQIYLTLGQPARPSMYQGSTINHVYACNTFDGCTAFHRAIQCSDQKTGLAILNLLLTKDTPETAVINVLDMEGLTPLHLACKLDHRLAVKRLLSLHYIDLNIRTRVGNLPDEMAKSERSKVAKLVRNARANVKDNENEEWTNIPDYVTQPSTGGGSSIDLDDLDERFREMKNARY